jgi:hypothetical protein
MHMHQGSCGTAATVTQQLNRRGSWERCLHIADHQDTKKQYGRSTQACVLRTRYSRWVSLVLEGVTEVLISAATAIADDLGS